MRTCRRAGRAKSGCPGTYTRVLELSSTHGLRKTLSRCVGEDAVSVTPVWFRVPSSQNYSSPALGLGHWTRNLDAFFPRAQAPAHLAFLW